MSCNFMPCNSVRQFHVLQFHVRHFQRPHNFRIGVLHWAFKDLHAKVTAAVVNQITMAQNDLSGFTILLGSESSKSAILLDYISEI